MRELPPGGQRGLEPVEHGFGQRGPLADHRAGGGLRRGHGTRATLHERPGEHRPVLTPVEDIPDAFMGDALNADNLDYVLSLYAEYYEKQQVTAAEGE